MACGGCAARRARMKAYIVRKMGYRYAEQPADIQQEQAEGQATQAKGSGQAGDACTAHGDQGMAGDASAGAD